MQVERKSITNAKSAKDYLSRNEVPQLFECLMTGLMYHRPSDHITYLQDCLERIKKQGVNGVRWDMFLDSKKTPLPPIDAAPRENFRPQPLPEIGSLQIRLPVDSTVILVQAGPGIDKKSICKYLILNFPEFIHIDTGTLVRDRALIEAQESESRWRFIKSTIDNGDLASEDFVIECLIRELNKYDDRNKFIIEGYPRTDAERRDFERFIGFGRLKFMLLIDCEEDACHKLLQNRAPKNAWCDHSQPAINKRIFNYKSNTLAVCKYFDDNHKLRVIDGDKDHDHVMKDILRAFSKELESPPCLNPPIPEEPPEVKEEPVIVSMPGREPVLDVIQLLDINPESERNSDLPQCRLVFLLGGPGSGKSEVAQLVCKKHPTWFHIDVHEIIRSNGMASSIPDNSVATCNEIQQFVENWDINIDVLKSKMKSIPEETELIILEGYPENSSQLNQFNNDIGRVDFVILLDCEEDVMRSRLAERYCREHNVEDDEINSDMRVLHFKEKGLPICRYYDELEKMCVVPGDRDILYVTSDFEKVAIGKLELIVEAELQAALNLPPIIENNHSDIDIDDEKSTEILGDISVEEEVDKGEKRDNDYDENTRELFDTKGEEQENSVNNTEENDKSDDIFGLFDSQDPEQENNFNKIEDQNVKENIDEENNGDYEALETFSNDLMVKDGAHASKQPQLEDTYMILLLGGPGSGKKTLGTHLSNKYPIVFKHIDELVHEAIEAEYDGTKQFKKYLENKDFDETPMFSLIGNYILSSTIPSRIFVIAGFPRTVGQYLKFQNEVCPIAATIFLDVDEDTLKNRLAARADPDLPLNFLSQLEAFKLNCPELLEELSGSELFTKIDGSLSELEVLEHVSVVIEQYPFIHNDL